VRCPPCLCLQARKTREGEGVVLFDAGEKERLFSATFFDGGHGGEKRNPPHAKLFPSWGCGGDARLISRLFAEGCSEREGRLVGGGKKRGGGRRGALISVALMGMATNYQLN